MRTVTGKATAKTSGSKFQRTKKMTWLDYILVKIEYKQHLFIVCCIILAYMAEISLKSLRFYSY